jgi:murein L,D-transpeptidase YafK
LRAGSACEQAAFKDNILLNGLGHGRRNLGFGIARHPSSFAVSRRAQVRALLTSAALAASLALAGCNSDEISLANNAKANQPVPPKLVADMTAKDMDLNSPILVRLFKQEAELEVWKQTRSGQFALLKTYPICRWSGDLGPKVREGDRQAPEGFYSITPGQMNPQSAYYLSFNIGYPNAFDKALGRTGSQLMVHGDCSSRGCYAMTDEQIAEIYSLGRESFFGGQRAFQVQAYPFKFTPVNMAKHRNNPHMPFWKMIKEGYDHFEVTRQEPKVEFCENKYVFDPAQPPNSSKPLTFNAAGKCPAYVVPDDVAEAVRGKQQQDAAETAKLISKGTPVARLNTGIDGGMNKVFAAKLPGGETGLSEGGEGQSLSLLALARAPGTIPSHVNPPKNPLLPSQEEPVVAVPVTTKVASVTPEAKSEGFFSSLARKVGLSGPDTTSSAASPKAKTEAKDSSRPAVLPKSVAPKPADTRVATARPPFKPTVSDPSAAPAAKDTLVTGAQPIVPTSSFESRFSAVK